MQTQPESSGADTMAARIKSKRAIDGLSQAEAARMWGFNKFTLQQWERGRCHPRGLHRARIESILAAPPMDAPARAIVAEMRTDARRAYLARRRAKAEKNSQMRRIRKAVNRNLARSGRLGNSAHKAEKRRIRKAEKRRIKNAKERARKAAIERARIRMSEIKKQRARIAEIEEERTSKHRPKQAFLDFSTE